MTFLIIVFLLILLWNVPDWIREYRLSKKVNQFKLQSEKRIERLIEDRKKFLENNEKEKFLDNIK